MTAGGRHVEDRQAIDADADGAQVRRHQPRAQPHEPRLFVEVEAGEPVESRGGRIFRPMRRPEPLHAPALLIDEHRRIGALDDVAKDAGETRDLRAIADIPPEQDQTPGTGAGDEAAFVAGKVEAGAAADEGARGALMARRHSKRRAGAGRCRPQLRATKQAPPPAFSLLHRTLASSLASPTTRTR